jgi:hypothetical protein
MSRINYVLQNVSIAFKQSGGGFGSPTVLQGIQSVGASSNTNIESFSAFGSSSAKPIKLDMDLELTLERALTGTTSAYVGWGSEVKIFITYQYGAAGSLQYRQISLEGVGSSYSVQMGVDGPATESVTIQNAGNVTFEQSSASPIVAPGGLCSVVTRPDFNWFGQKMISDPCNSPNSGTWSKISSNVLSASMSWDASLEKVNVLGQSMPIGKFVTFPVEVSTEVEFHAATAPSAPNSSALTSGTELTETEYDLELNLGGTYRATKKAVAVSSSIQGGDVGGGNVSTTDSYTSYTEFYTSKISNL